MKPETQTEIKLHNDVIIKPGQNMRIIATQIQMNY